MELIVYVNGKFRPQSEATVNVFDHGLLYGDGIFEGIRAYNGRIFKLERHLDRLYASAKAIDLKIPHRREDLTEIILETCRRNKIQDGYIRPIITRGPGDLGIDPRKCKSGPTVVVIAQPTIALYRGDAYEHGLRLVTSPYRRGPPPRLHDPAPVDVHEPAGRHEGESHGTRRADRPHGEGATLHPLRRLGRGRGVHHRNGRRNRSRRRG